MTLFNNVDDNLPDTTLTYADLVGEGKKFKTPEDLAKAKIESDNYIRMLEKQKDEIRSDYLALREQHNAGPKLQELLDRLAAAENKSSNDTPPMNDERQAEFDPTKVEELINKRIQNHELEKKYNDNFHLVETKLRERYGTGYQGVLKQQMDDLGLTQEQVNTLAREAPKAFFRTMGLDTPAGDTFSAPPRGSLRSDQFAPKGNTRNETYYDKLKRENLDLYLNPKTQVQMHKDAQELGEAYFT